MQAFAGEAYGICRSWPRCASRVSFSIERQSRAKHPLPACVLVHRVSERERRRGAVRVEWVGTFENVMMNYTQLHAVGDQRGQ